MRASLPKKAKRPYSQLLYYFKAFKRYVVVLTLFVLLIGSINILVNQKYYQIKLAQKLYELTNIEITFENLHLNLFAGRISGQDIKIQFHKTKLSLDLSQFKIKFSPLHLLIAKVNLKAIEADTIFIDLSELISLQKKQTEPKPITNLLPQFLQRLELRQAKINQLFINRGEKGFVSVDSIQLQSLYGSFFTESPVTLSADNLRFISPKVQILSTQLQAQGNFTLDLTQDLLLSQSEALVHVKITDTLFAFDKKPKPWLTNPAWDKDLESTLHQFYGDTLPNNKTYLYLSQVQFGLNLLNAMMTLQELEIQMDEAKVLGNLKWNRSTTDFELNLKTDKPLPFSKLPLGQAQLRSAFNGLFVQLGIKGTVKDLQHNDLRLQLEASALGNRVHPEAGDLLASLNARILNAVLTSDNISLKLSDGRIDGGGVVHLENLNAGLKFKSENFDAQTFIRLFSTINIASKVNGNGSLQGSLKDPNLVANLTSTNATYEFLNFGAASANLAIKNKTLTLDVQTEESLVGNAKLALKIENVYDSFAQKMDLKTEFTDLKVAQLLNSKNIEGLASGVFNLKRSENQNQGSGLAKVVDTKILGQPYGVISAPFVLKNKHFDLKPIQMQLFTPAVLMSSDKGLSFDFDDTGYTFSGFPIDGLFLKGKFLKAQKEFLQIEGEAKDLSLFFLKPFYPIDISKSKTSAKFSGRYHIYDPRLSDLNLKLQDVNLQTPDGLIQLNKPATLNFKNKTFHFTKFEIKHGQGLITLDGALGLENATQLKVTGTVDFNPWAEMNPFISYSEKPIAVDLLLKGETFKPLVFGKVKLDNDTIEFRKIASDFENLTGTLTFDGNKIASENFNLLYDDGELNLKGWVKTDYNIITDADMSIVGKEISVHMQNGTDLLTDMDLMLTGNTHLSINGRMNIVQGQYTLDYGITNFIIKPQVVYTEIDETRWAMLPTETKLNIKLKNTGDFVVDNNLAYLELNLDLLILGTLKTPMLSGQVDFLNGKIHSLGVYFEEATGYAQFREGPDINPYINLKATTEVQNYAIIAHANGTLDNLKLLLDSNPTLDRKDIMSLLFYGQTSDQLVENSSNTFLQTAAITQLATVLSQPLSKISGLDYFNVSQRQETSQDATQRISIGKSLSKRLNLAFTTDLNNEDPERAIEVGVQVFDAFSLIFAKDFGDRYRLDLNLRFESF